MQPHQRKFRSQEILALQQQGTWSLVPPPPNHKILGCRQRYKTKLKPNGSVALYKGHLIAQGFNQQFGINYSEIFSLIAKMPIKCIYLKLQLIITSKFFNSRQPIPFFMANYKRPYICNNPLDSKTLNIKTVSINFTKQFMISNKHHNNGFLHYSFIFSAKASNLSTVTHLSFYISMAPHKSTFTYMLTTYSSLEITT